MDKNYKKHFSYNEFVREMGFKNCHDIPSSCWLYIACNEVGWFQTLSDRYPSLRKFLGLKQFSKVRILFHELWMNENQNMTIKCYYWKIMHLRTLYLALY